MPAFVAGSEENAKRPKNLKRWLDKNYFDGLAEPLGYTFPEKFDNRKGYGLMMWKDRYLDTARGLAKRFAPVYTFLELGCAKGFLPQAFRMQGIDAVGVDISMYAIANCHPEMLHYLFRANATDLKRFFGDDTFDLVYSWDFMEHLTPEEIIKCLKESKRIGKHWINHNITVFDKDYGSVAKRFYMEPQDPTHVSCYTKEWWRAIFNKVFSDDEIKSFEFIGAPFQGGKKRRGMLETVIKIKKED